MPETIEELNAYLAARYSQPPYSTCDLQTAPLPQPQRQPAPPHPLSPSPEWRAATQAFYAQLSAEPSLSQVPLSFAPTPSPGPATPKVVPPHLTSPPAAPPAERQKNGTPRAPS